MRNENNQFEIASLQRTMIEIGYERVSPKEDRTAKEGASQCQKKSMLVIADRSESRFEVSRGLK